MSDDDFDTPGRDSEPDTTLIASAYLDDEATTDERALVETSPDALDEVRRFGDVRTVLAGTAPDVSLSERENHLATALDVWSRTSNGERDGESLPRGSIDRAATTTGSTRRSSKRKRGSRGSADGFGASQWFLSAAAVLVVVAGGAAIVRGILADEGVGENVALDSAATEAPAGVEDNDALEAAEVEGENVGSDAVLPEDQIEGEAFEDGSGDTAVFDERAESDDAVDDSAMDDSAMGDEAMEESAATAADEPAGDDVPEDAVQPSPAPEDDLAELTTRDDLAEFAALVIPAIGDGPVDSTDIDAESPFETCVVRLDIDEVAGFARYRGVEVTVGVDLNRNVAIAYVDDAVFGGDCEVLETAPLPDPDAPRQP
jgi:hypothetical protein